MRFPFSGLFCLALLAISTLSPSTHGETLPNTDTLEMQGDVAMQLVDNVDAFLLRELERSVDRREEHWQRDRSSWAAHQESIKGQRARLSSILGIRDARVAPQAPNILSANTQTVRIGHGTGFDVFVIRWTSFGHVTGEGLMLEPTSEAWANVIAIPDCEWTPEQLVGLSPGIEREMQYARRLAESGCRVYVPMLINRQRKQFDWGPRPAPDITNREMLYRSAYELGRGLIGYEVQKVLSLVDYATTQDLPIGIIGWGEGGLIALYSSAVDERIDSTCVSGYFDSRQNAWQEPLDRNVFGLLEQFGDAELATMILPRQLLIEAAAGPVADFPGNGGGPARLRSPELESVQAEMDRAKSLVTPLSTENFKLLKSGNDGQGNGGSSAALTAFCKGLDGKLNNDTGQPPQSSQLPDAAARHRRQMREIDEHSQAVLRKSGAVRAEFMKGLNTSSEDAYNQSVEDYRRHFYDEVIGRFDHELAAPAPRSRRIYETEHWRGYEVVLDVFDGVFAYGILILPKDLKEGEQRPVVVCQHGLEGRPQDTVGIQSAHYYSGFAGELAKRGYITFSPQNLYIGYDRFRTLQRKSYLLKKTLFSTITPQHQQIIHWLKTLPYVDDDRIAFYGLSYGGKTAMRVPAILTDYCLSICSADFNEWVDKNASTHNPRSYVWSGEYEIFEFDLGSTFNYAEMAALIAPRPFMVERGHDDGVADDWTVGWEFGKVRNLYASRLKLPERCEIEWFDGPHKINGVKTYEFLDRQLQWNSKTHTNRTD